jgi:hypothetical protein
VVAGTQIVKALVASLGVQRITPIRVTLTRLPLRLSLDIAVRARIGRLGTGPSPLLTPESLVRAQP